MSDLFVDNIKHQSSQGSGTITIGASGEKVNLGTDAGGTLTNYPAFGLKFTGDNLPSGQNVFTKIPSGNITMVYNVGNAFDTSNSRFIVPSGYAGKYFFYCKFLSLQNTNVYRGEFFKNGSSMFSSTNAVSGQARTSEGDSGFTLVDNSLFADLAEGDYVEFYIKNSSATTTIHNPGSRDYNFFFGYRLVGI